MNKNILSIAVIATLGLGLSGCGGGGGGSDETSNNTKTPTDVTVERGKIYDATVTDSSTSVQTAIAKTNKNVYTFEDTPTYPIKVNGGWIDLNDNGIKDTDDMPLEFELLSDTNIVTPVTTYLAHFDESSRSIEMQKLMDAIDTTESDLLSAPSESSTNAILLQNAIYQVIEEKSNTNLTSNFEDIENYFDEFKIFFEQSGSQAGEQTSENIAKWVENQIVDGLVNNGLITKFTESDISGNIDDPDSDIDNEINKSDILLTINSIAATNAEDEIPTDKRSCEEFGYATYQGSSNRNVEGEVLEYKIYYNEENNKTCQEVTFQESSPYYYAGGAYYRIFRDAAW